MPDPSDSTSKKDTPDDLLLTRQKQIFNRLFSLLLMIGLFPYAILCYDAVTLGDTKSVIFFTGCYVWLAGVTLLKDIPHGIRVWAGLIWFYGLGVFTLTTEGMVGSTRIYFICFAAFGGLFAGLRGGIVCLVVSLTSFIMIGLLHFTLFPGLVHDIHSISRYAALVSTFFVLSGSITLCFALLVREMEASGRELRQHLALSRDRLMAQEQEELRLRKKLAQSEKLKNLGLLAGSVAHDLNNILAGIATYPEVLLMDQGLQGKVRQGLKIIQDSGRKASSVVGDLLTISRGASAEMEIININTVVERYMTAAEFEKIKQTYPLVRIDTMLEPELFNVRGSYIHLEKTIMNLVLNAVEETALQRDGQVIVSTANQCVDKGSDAFEDIPSGEYVTLSVEDNGSGIQEAFLEKIFDPFFTQKEMGKSGTGLGLTVVWNTVQDHNGFIRVFSDRNGTRFDLLFPAIRQPLPAQEKVSSIKEIKGNGERILVVDDLPDQRKIAGTILRNLGYEVYTVSDGVDAVAFIRENPVDLVILDMIMEPSISGLETYRRMKEIYPGQKAIIASGHSVSEEVLEAQNLGAGSFVKKPFTILDMGIAVKEELEKDGTLS